MKIHFKDAQFRNKDRGGPFESKYKTWVRLSKDFQFNLVVTQIGLVGLALFAMI